LYINCPGKNIVNLGDALASPASAIPCLFAKVQISVNQYFFVKLISIPMLYLLHADSGLFERFATGFKDLDQSLFVQSTRSNG
jgi:hypothetical protein